jgi:glycosyltransferase involved in cell wall biosynthesis
MNNPIRLLFVGFINKEKGIFELLKSIQKLPSNIYLDICGNKKDITTEEYKEFEKLCNKMGKQICRHGYVVGEEKDNLFKAADIFVLPTYGEGLPLVLLEALHFGLPIITTPVGSIPEVLKEEENVIFVEPKNIESLVKGIERLLYNQDLWKKMSKNNSILANQYFIENNIKELCDIYNDVAKY